MFIILITAFILAVPYIPICDGDTFFHLTAGRYIFTNAFPVKDPFSFHDISYMPHEWLSDVIFYVVYKVSGYAGLFIFQYMFIMILLWVMYRLNLMVSKDRKYIAFLGAVIPMIFINQYFITIRPQIFTYILFIFEIYVIEAFITYKNKRLLYLLPVLSLAVANFHMGTYPLFFILSLPYLMDNGVKLHLGRIKSRRFAEGNDGVFLPLLISMLCSIPVGILNPYGIKKMNYFALIFRSEVTYNISEWLTPDFDTWFGISIFLCLFTLVALFMVTKRDISLRTMLMLSGTGYMVLSGVRYFAYFLLMSGYLVIEYINSSITDEQWGNAQVRIKKLLNRKIMVILMAGILVFAIASKYASDQIKITDFRAFPDKAVEYLKEHTDYKNLKLYNEYYHGGFLMFNGIKVFIDSRGDLFVKEYNPECMVLNDYRQVMYGMTHYKDIFDKYNFDHALVYKGRIVDNMLQHDSNWRKVYSDTDFVLYEKICK